MPPDVPAPVRLARRTVYESHFVNLHLDRVRFPGDRVIEDYTVLGFDTEAAAALVDDADGNLLLVESYRYVTGTVEWEIPAGHIDAGETALAAAQREALEETGWETTDPRLVYTYNPMLGQADKVFHIVRCSAVRQVGDFDHSEVRSVGWRSPASIRQMIRDNEIRDGYTLTALLLHFAELA